MKRYEKYQSTDYQWIGDVPAHWQITPLFTCVGETQAKNIGNTETNVLSLSYGRIKRRNVESLDGLLPESFETYQKVFPGQIVLRLTDLQNDKRSLRVGLVNHAGIITSAYTALKPKKSLQSKYAYYLLHAYDLCKVYYGLGGGVRQTIKFADLKWLPFLVPTYEERETIAAFLDYETARIDRLIEKQQRLIELLQEKRQAAISHAVTNGLNPAAPMRDSGVEWLGEVPDNWGVLKLRWVAKMESGHTPSRKKPEYWENCDVPWFTLADVWQLRDGRQIRVKDTKERVSELGLENSSARKLPPGTVILSRTASVGFAGIMDVEMATTQDFANWVCGPKLTPDYLYFVLRAMQPEFSRLMRGSTHQTIYMPDIHEFVVPLPTVAEQKKIVQALHSKLPTIDGLIDRQREMNDLLIERRSAVISEAVTGKIDVRDWTPPVANYDASTMGNDQLRAAEDQASYGDSVFPEIDHQWQTEAEDRINAEGRGEMASVSATEVFRKHRDS